MPGHVEFLHDEPDEPAPPAGRPPRRHVPLHRIGAALVVLAALVVWGLTRPDDGTGHPAARAPRSTPVPSSPAPSATPSVQPRIIACRLGAPVANEIVTAMQHYLPTIKIDNLRAYRCVRGSGETGRIVFEAISGRVGALNIDVEATLRTGDHAGSIASPRLGAGARKVLLGRAESYAAGLQVAVNAYGRAGERAPSYAMRGLADFVSLNVIL